MEYLDNLEAMQENGGMDINNELRNEFDFSLR